MTERATESPGSPDRSPGLTLYSYDGRPYRFDPGALCLELLPTGGPGAFARYEVLHTPADLAAWAERSRLPQGLDLRVTEAELVRVRKVRDALFLLTADRAHGRPLGPDLVEVLNTAAAEPPLVSRLTPDGTRAWAPGATGTGLLSTVARDAIDLFSGPHADRVRECGAHDCHLLFVDTSRPGRRRWCAMEHCGNREKVRAHRARTRRGAGDGSSS
ncbi:CGNR zinc finger domain-containing protein [Streptomyces sp. NPDC014776]|uniref:CGNR zinc finger domain-containing protein n=1 Tax=Streptomyces sp. NPDC014776 TaxID=3364909 RepID=UPI003701C274